MNKKKLVGLIIILTIFFGGFIGVLLNSNVEGSTEKVDGITWYYTVSNGEAINVYVSSGTPTGTLKIPDTLGGYPVTRIVGSRTSTTSGDSYRYNILGKNVANTTITNVIIPSTVTNIGNNTFANFDAVKSFTIPDSVINIGYYSFYDCDALETVNYGENSNLSSIDNYAFYYCEKLKKVNIPNSVISLGAFAYKNCYSLSELTLSENIQSIGNSAFENDSNISGKLVIPSKVGTIGYYAFYGNSGLTDELVIPSNVKAIYDYAFFGCTGLTGVSFEEGVLTISDNAFYNCKGIKGDLIIPDSVTTLGANAFYGCTGIDGNIYVGKGVKTISNCAFDGCNNAFKATVSSGTTSIGYKAFNGFSDIWVENTPNNVSVNSGFSGDNNKAKIHWLGETHRINVSVLPGIKIVNTNTSAQIVSGDYECEASFDFKVEVDNSYNYNDLKLTIMEDDENYKIYDVNPTEIYKIERLTKDKNIIVQNLSQGLDLSLRTFITEINREPVTDSREPITKLENGEYAYVHTKFPLKVKSGNLITYKVRVYNEGMTEGTANKVSMYIPEGLEFIDTNKTNNTYEWIKESDDKISTTYLSNKTIQGYSGIGTLKYEDIELVLQLSAKTSVDEDLRFVTMCEIEEQSAVDSDSTPGSITSIVTSDYKQDESYASTGSSYIKGIEDDDDFENVFLNGKIKVDYTIRIDKIDGDTKELLSGAKFNLLDKDGNVIKTSVTTDEGYLDFGMITTYGEGEDVYYIEEVATPEGYIVIEKSKIKVVVTKTIVNEEQGTYSVNVVCEVLDYRLDTTRYEYTPIYTLEQLRKIGSGETVTIDGVDYKYMPNSNYKLMADIDASSIEWTPIEVPFTGILDGNNHKISNIHYTNDSAMNIKEVGMFRYVDGIIENLELDNVAFNIKNIDDDAEGITDYSGVGGFAGVMAEGTIRNCIVSGSVEASTNNIGGFVGHTIPGKIVKFQNCTNNATVVGNQATVTSAMGSTTVQPSNIGGLVGCALGALSVSDCINNGQIVCCNYNVGGLVGYVKSTNYQEVNIKADFDEGEKVINLVVENIRTTGKYELELETRDAKTLGLIEGAVYTILDENRNPIPGCENVQLVDGKLKVATIDINNLGIDTYYIKENETVPGYKKLTGNIKLEVRRYWDDKTESFKVSVETENLSNDEFDVDEPTESQDNIPSQTGSIFTKVKFENVSFNSNKAEFKNCINNGEIVSTYMNAAGIVGTSHCLVKIESCENTGNIQAIGYGKAGGIASEIHAWKLNQYIEIKDCTNSGKVVSQGGTGSAGGIVAHSLSDIKISNCNNTGEIISGNQSAASGILADANGIIMIDSCANEGKIIASSTSTYSDVNCVAAGIFAKNIVVNYPINGITTKKADNHLIIANCTNKGNIVSNCHTGGIIANTMANTVQIKNCNVEDMYIYDTYSGDKGGIAGFISSERVEIENCNVNNVDLDRKSSVRGDTYGGTGGIVGNITRYAPYEYANVDILKIYNCKVTNSSIKTQGKETAGILGFGYGVGDATDIIISDCYVDNCDILNRDVTSGTYGSSGGIIGATFEAGNIVIDNNTVKQTSIESIRAENYNNGGDYNVAGVFGIGFDSTSTKISNTDVIDCTIENNGTLNDGCSNAAGIVGTMGIKSNYSNSTGEILNCNVINTNVTTHAGNLGGILALGFKFSEGHSYTISNCKVQDSILSSDANTSSNSVTGGIAAFVYSTTQLKNCTVENTHILQNTTSLDSGTNTAGILGYAMYSASLDNCNVYNSEIYSTGKYGSSSYAGSCISGIVGSINNNAYLTNCNVDNTTITSTQGANTVGLLGSNCGGSTYEIVAKGCSVTNSEITSSTTLVMSSTNSTVAGLMGAIFNQKGAVIDNCKVEKCNISGKGVITSGAIAFSNKLVITNTLVKDLEIADEGQNAQSMYGTRSVGGVFGSTNTLNADNVNIQNINIVSHTNSVGGLGGSAGTIENLSNCTVDGITIDNSSTLNIYNASIAGVIADILSVDNAINNITVKNSDIKTDSDNAGGVFATINGNAVLNNCIVDNVHVENRNLNNVPLGNVGGIVTYNAGTLQLNNSGVKNSSVKISGTITNYKHAGGLIGFTNGANINNSDVENTIITNNTFGNTGGLIGMTNKSTGTQAIEAQVKLSDSNVINCTNITGNGHTGGILGFGKLISTSGKVSGSKINGNSNSTYTDVGGVIGNSLSTSDIKNIQVIDSQVVANSRAAGIAGFAVGDITNCTVTGTTITTNGQSSDVGGIVGSAANSSSEITNCTVNNSTITSINGYNGGIAGFANNTITGSDVINTTITATGTSANGLGGIVGHGSNYLTTKTYLEDCEVNGCTLSGLDGVGGIAGVAVSEIVNCRVIGVASEEEILSVNTLMINEPISVNTSVITEDKTSKETEEKATENVVDEVTEEEKIEDTDSKETEEENTEKVVDEVIEEEKVDNTESKKIEEENTEKVVDDVTEEENTEKVVDEVTEEEKIENTESKETEEKNTEKVVDEVTEEKVESTESKEKEEKNTENVVNEVSGEKMILKTRTLATSLEDTSTYTTTITGRNNVGGIIGDGGQLFGETKNKFVTLTNCLLKGTKITGTTNLKETIGRNSYYSGDTTIYDIITGFISESIKLVTGE